MKDIPMNAPPPISEADLHAWLDGQLAAERAREVEAYLATRPEEAQRVHAWRAQKRELRALFDPVQDEPLPSHLIRSARQRTPWYAQRLVAGLALALVSGALGWSLRGAQLPEAGQLARHTSAADGVAQTAGFVQRAAVAHAVYAPDQRRPVEVDAAHEDQLVAWLSKRMGAPMRPPHLQATGYSLEGGRLLPGGQGPAAQFMYRDAQGRKLTLYVSNQINDLAEVQGSHVNTDTAFRFAREGGVNVFYWVDGPFGYALSSEADRGELARISVAVHQQLSAAARP